MNHLKRMAGVMCLVAGVLAGGPEIHAQDTSTSILSEIQQLRAAGRSDEQILAVIKSRPWSAYRYDNGIQTAESEHIAPADILFGIIKFEQAASKRVAAQASNEKYEADKRLCNIRSTCRTFADARQACAVAGSYQTCMRIKVDNLLEAETYCIGEGTLKYNAEKVPSAFACLLMPRG